MTKTNSVKLLKKYTGKKHIFFTDRGNTSIKLALKLAKDLGKKKAFIQDQGGWITYEQFLKKLKFDYEFLQTDYGIVPLKELEAVLDEDSVLLINSMPAYFALQEDMDKIEKVCKKKKAFLINDVSGSIGLEQGKHGDIVLGSFGKWKPLELNYGGFLAFDGDYEEFFKKNSDKKLKNFYNDLQKRLKELPKRIKGMKEKAEKVKEQLQRFGVVHNEKIGYNVIVRFDGPEAKLKIVEFCKLYGYEFTLCPRYIRVMDDAISIELKRL